MSTNNFAFQPIFSDLRISEWNHMLKTNAHQNTMQSEKKKKKREKRKERNVDQFLLLFLLVRGGVTGSVWFFFWAELFMLPDQAWIKDHHSQLGLFQVTFLWTLSPKQRPPLATSQGKGDHRGVIAELLTVTLSQLQPSSSCCDSCTRSWQQWRKFSSLSSEELISLVQQCFKSLPTSEQNKGQTFTQVSLTQCATHWHLSYKSIKRIRSTSTSISCKYNLQHLCWSFVFSFFSTYWVACCVCYN